MPDSSKVRSILLGVNMSLSISCRTLARLNLGILMARVNTVRKNKMNKGMTTR